ncbi:MAG TPA: adenylate/guanylate cyclase domain-containing protein [Burkholderiales bacterium]|nr:adenylate/guanylate cyclase domain-containing protein [Burkholderiales bacterium]
MAAQVLDTSSVQEWLDAGAQPAERPQDVLQHLCRRLVGLGMPLYRVAVFVRTLHPNVAGRAFIWHEPQDAVEIVTAELGIQETDTYLKSPVRVVFTEHVEVRRRIGPGALDFPILEDLRKEGATDFFAVPMRFINGEVHGASFVTRRAGGFADAELEALRRIMPAFSRVAEIYAWKRTARNILDAYLGEQTGEKVLAGRIRRGDGEDIRAVIWFCDLRDSTPLADSMSRVEFLRLLNEFFECVLGPVLEQKGEVLRFIGDAALAIFPIPQGDVAERAGAARRAVQAAQAAVERMAAFNARRERKLRFGIGLHLGHVLYGNIGTPTRIEFTVIGAAANEAARIEGFCKTLDVPLVLSEPVARHVADCVSLGSHRLRGVEEPIELFTLKAIRPHQP